MTGVQTCALPISREENKEEAKPVPTVISATTAREVADESDKAFNAIMLEVAVAKDDGFYRILYSHSNVTEKCKMRLEALGYKVDVSEHITEVSWKKE